MRDCGDKTLPVWRLVTGNVSVCTYVGGGGVVGGRASSASANSWESQQSIPVSLGRDQRYQTISHSYTTSVSISIIFVEVHLYEYYVLSLLCCVCCRVDHLDWLEAEWERCANDALNISVFHKIHISVIIPIRISSFSKEITIYEQWLNDWHISKFSIKLLWCDVQ